MSYLVWKLLHVLAVIAFVGNITTGILWKVHADRTRTPELIAHACAGLTRSDRWFTIPGVALILIAGIVAAITGNFPILGTGWIFWSIVLFTISGRGLHAARRTAAAPDARDRGRRRQWPRWIGPPTKRRHARGTSGE